MKDNISRLYQRFQSTGFPPKDKSLLNSDETEKVVISNRELKELGEKLSESIEFMSVLNNKSITFHLLIIKDSVERMIDARKL